MFLSKIQWPLQLCIFLPGNNNKIKIKVINLFFKL